MLRLAPPRPSRLRLVLLAVLLSALLLAGVGITRAVTGGPVTEDTAGTTSAPADAAPTPDAAKDTVPGLPEYTGADGNNNEVVVVNTTDGLFKHRAGSGTARVTGDSVDSQNAAAASSSCTDCRTVAVATQVVLVQSDTSYAAPRNLAIALNNQCSGCTTFAAAYQYVVSTDGLVRFTPEGQSRMAAIESQIRELTGQEMDLTELRTRLDALVHQLWVTVDQEMVRLGVSFDATPKVQVDVATSPEAAAPSPSATTPSDTESPSATSSPAPTDSASPTTSDGAPGPTPAGTTSSGS